ncbi:hypothetical protein DTO027I6_450 [Penicillium roqueforti]|nr:hypothetical protein DTO027I6_450 [Penicillium roqueforti]KAI3230909.1 hypothetical protein DTO012A7_5811 [Penicillium roqueforti]
MRWKLKAQAYINRAVHSYLVVLIPAVITYVFPPLLLQGSWPSGIGNRSAQLPPKRNLSFFSLQLLSRRTDVESPFPSLSLRRFGFLSFFVIPSGLKR